MKKVLITGSADGLDQMGAQLLVKDGHQVMLHARNKARGEEAWLRYPVQQVLLPTIQIDCFLISVGSNVLLQW